MRKFFETALLPKGTQRDPFFSRSSGDARLLQQYMARVIAKQAMRRELRRRRRRYVDHTSHSTCFKELFLSLKGRNVTTRPCVCSISKHHRPCRSRDPFVSQYMSKVIVSKNFLARWQPYLREGRGATMPITDHGNVWMAF